MTHDAIVIGAGLAGSSTALRLARRGRRVLLLEAGHYPSHKMCGEFLSPESQHLFRGLGIESALWARGAVPIRRVAVTSPSGAVWRERLPGDGIGISRWALDPLLFDAAVEAGAEGLQGSRVRSVEGSPAGGFRVGYERNGRPHEASARLVVGAFGKRSQLDRALSRSRRREPHNFVAFKMHYTGVDLGDWIELHAFEGGYCGLSHVEEGRVNACLIARADTLKASGRSFAGMCEGVMRTNPALAERLERLAPAMDEPISIGQIGFSPKELFSHDVMMVGDTAAMIAPLCGDGMAMALRSAEMAAPLADRMLAGEITFEELRRDYTRLWHREFARRLKVGRVLQEVFFSPRLARVGLAAVNTVPWVGRALIRATRDTRRAPSA